MLNEITRGKSTGTLNRHFRPPVAQSAAVKPPADQITVILSERDYRAATGSRLRQLLRALELTQVQAAADMGIGKTRLANWLAGKHAIGPYQLYRFCRVRGVNSDWIWLADPSSLPHWVYERLMQEKALLSPADLSEPAPQQTEKEHAVLARKGRGKQRGSVP